MSLRLPAVIGHRGVCRYAPENTLASLRKAHALGIRWVEFDVALTQDGEAIILHDATLDRTTNGHGAVADVTAAHVATLDAGSWFSAEFSGEKVPTLVEYLTCAAELGLGINVEIKPTRGQDKQTARKVVETLHTQWRDADNLLVSSFSLASLLEARSLDKQMNMGLLINRWLPEWQSIAAQVKAVSLHLKYTLLTAETVAAIKLHVPYVLAYTVNDAALANKLFAMGVDAVFSDAPDRVRR